MINEKIDNCIQRVSLLKKDHKPESSEEVIKNAETKLNILLPKDFRILCTFYGYDYFHLFEFYNFDIGVIEETLKFRKNCNLPHNYIVLTQDNDVSFVLLKTISAEESEVIWCDYMDFFNLCDGKPMVYNPTIFATFTDFYEFLLDEEEKSLAENS